MTTRRSILLGLLAIAIVACASAIACDPEVKVAGKVHDHQGSPLEGVTVTLHSEGRGPHTTVSAKDGSFTVGIIGADPEHISLVFEKQGYKTLQMPFDSKQDSVQITLEAETAQNPH